MDELKKLVAATTVFARMSPDDKELVLKWLKDVGMVKKISVSLCMPLFAPFVFLFSSMVPTGTLPTY